VQGGSFGVLVVKKLVGSLNGGKKEGNDEDNTR